MPFNLRKSIDIGSPHSHSSGSAIGVPAEAASLGSGTGPPGYYIHGGTDGFHYKSASLDTDAESMSKTINERMSKLGLWPVPIVIAAVAALILLGLAPTLAPIAILIGAIGVAAAYWLYRQDNIRFTTVLAYDLDRPVADVFEKFTSEFDELSKTRKAMNIEMKGAVYDWKRHGGAAFEVLSVPAQFGRGAPKRIETNIAVPYIGGGSSRLYFFPDQLLICQGRGASGSHYRNVAIEFHDQQFHETASVPEDAVVVGSTWRFVRRDGGPDRRFKDNREIPVANYQAMVINAPANFQKVLYLSKNIARNGFLTAISGLADLHIHRR